MAQSSTKAAAPSLNCAASLAATSGALHQTLLMLAAVHGGRGGPWLDQLEAQFIRNAKNMTFTGTGMEAEAQAVDAALANLKLVMTKVRIKLAEASSAKAAPRRVQSGSFPGNAGPA